MLIRILRNLVYFRIDWKYFCSTTESDPLLQHVPQDNELKSTLGSVASDDCEISVLENTGECPEPSLCLQVPSYVYINLKSIISTKYVSLRGDVDLGLKNLFKPVTIFS
jgi:hypothetical protein